MLSERERDELLIRIEERLKSIKGDLEDHNKAIYGNGHPGLLERVQKLEGLHRNEDNFFRKYGGFVGWIITTGIAIYALVKIH